MRGGAGQHRSPLGNHPKELLLLPRVLFSSIRGRTVATRALTRVVRVLLPLALQRKAVVALVPLHELGGQEQRHHAVHT